MELPSQRQVRSAAEAMRCVIAATFMLRRAALEIIGRADVISLIAVQDVHPSHRNFLGRPGLEPGTNALKGRCSTD